MQEDDPVAQFTISEAAVGESVNFAGVKDSWMGTGLWWWATVCSNARK
ncbi:MAG: hypothetical protein PHQ81_04045 [Methanofollis sp.]|nr:hypothetical protein [Methanofollis sp.]